MEAQFHESHFQPSRRKRRHRDTVSVNHDLDLAGTKRLTRFLIDAGVHGIMTTGGNGEFPHMLREEKKAVTAAIVEEAAGEIPIIAGTAAAGTREAVLWVKMRKRLARMALLLLRHTTSGLRRCSVCTLRDDCT